MIPLEVATFQYMMAAICVLFFLIGIWQWATDSERMPWVILCVVCAAVTAMIVVPPLAGNVWESNITICEDAAILGSSNVYVADMDGTVYSLAYNNPGLQMKAKHGRSIHASVYQQFGEKYPTIYAISEPIICSNQTC